MLNPVILCGGAGTRLWPLSRKSHPKQFVKLLGKESLFQNTAKRLASRAYSAPIIVTGSDLRFTVTGQLCDIGMRDHTILVEPSPKNTAPAVLAAAFHLHQKDPSALMLVLPSDHAIKDTLAFELAVGAAVDEAAAGRIVTFGVTPDRPETGYGYLELHNVVQDKPQQLKGFVEKPDFETATEMLHSGSFLWNAGIFLFSAETIIKAFEKYAPGMVEPMREAAWRMKADLNFFRLDPEAWEQVESISLDYAIMEKADNLSVVPFSGGWSDLGDWHSVWREMEKDNNNNAHAGNVTSIDCENSLIRSDSVDMELVSIGMKDAIIVATSDAVLVADKDKAQEVREAVEKLKAKNAPQAERFPRDYRPWGWFETMAVSDRFQVKRIVVNPSAALSLQSHMHRSEHWVVVSGTAKVTVDNEIRTLSESESIYIPIGAVHRMENPGKIPLVLIEVQTGSYLGEDDIVRYEDLYSRGQGEKG